MADLHILRHHSLGLHEARKVAYQWAKHVEQEFQMECTYQEGKSLDEVCFTRSGVNGTLHVAKDKFELNAKLGFLLGAFKSRIESEIVKNLDDLLRADEAAVKKAAAKKRTARKT